MRILHTSDWHIGRMLFNKKRYEEHEAFLDWLAGRIEQDGVSALLVSGDVFDTTTPSNRAQELYYRFLCRVATSSCRHVVIVAGNHDSSSFLDAPKELLRALNVHVIGCVSEAPEDEVLVLRNRQDVPELIVCAVPYLRDKDIRMVEAGESIEDKERKLVNGIRDHYAKIAALAEQQRRDLGAGIPIVGMGHLYTAGGQTIDGDGVRQLYVGSLAHVTATIFPPCLDYVALGHLHLPQKVGDSETIRYSGSPLPMGFGEARQQKIVCEVEFCGTAASVEGIDVPLFQKLERVKGDWEDISSGIGSLLRSGSRAWLEVIYEGDEIIGDLRERLEALSADSPMEILRVKDCRVIERVLGQAHDAEEIAEMSEHEVFERCLAVHEIPEEQRSELRRAYQEAVASLQDDDRAE